MAENKKSFIAYADWIELFEELEDDEAGRLVKHLFRYVNDMQPEAPDKLTKISFVHIKQALKRDLKKYESISERNKINGSKGGRPKKPKKPSGLNQNPEKPQKADSDNGNDSDKEDKKNNGDKSPDFDFDKFKDFVNKQLDRQFKVVNKSVKQSIKARLKEGYTKDNFINAVINCKNDPFHKEKNYRHCTLEFFSRAKTLESKGDKIQSYKKEYTDDEIIYPD